MRKTLITIAAAAVTLGAGAAQAQFAKSEDAIKYRQSAMFLMVTHLGRLGATVKGAVPFDAATVQMNAAVLEQLAQLPWQAFGAGTDTGATTRALPAIWTNNAKFIETSKRLQLETAKLSAAAKSGDLGQVKAAFGGVAQTCKACHDDFRKD